MRTLVVMAVAAVLSAFGATSAWAQQLSLGAKGGINITRMTFERDVIDDHIAYTTGFHAGALAIVDVNEWVGLELEAVYSQKGFENERRFSTLLEAGIMEASYLDVPVLLRLNVPTLDLPGGIAPHLFAGPVVSFELNCEFENVDCDDPGMDMERETTDLGARFGLGLDVPVGQGSLIGDAMYDLGLRDVNNRSDLGGYMKGRGLCFSLGYKLPVAGSR